MNGRMKCLLYILEKSKQCSKIRLTKVLFLMSRDNEITQTVKFYGFVPYHYGPYSFELFHDLQTFDNDGFIQIKGNEIISNRGEENLSKELKRAVDNIISRTESLSDRALVDLIYDRYPEYSIFSRYKRKMAYNRDTVGIITIGYEGYSIDEFFMRLVNEKIHALVDVRNNPWSMKFGFRQHQLDSYCEKLSIDYISMPSLGVPEDIRNNLKATGDYPFFFRTYRKLIQGQIDNLDYLKGLSKKKRIALMCFEHEPNRCHRSALGTELIRRGAEVTIR